MFQLNGQNTELLNEAPTLLPSSGHIFVHSPTYMEKPPPGNYADLTNFRTQDKVYMRGYKETVNITQRGGGTARWRRIVFSTHGRYIFNASIANKLYSYNNVRGYVRTVSEANQAMKDNLLNVLFRGTEGEDWVNIYNAKVDPLRVKVHYDRTFNLNPGNGEGHLSQKKFWHPLNKNFYYDDDESGDFETESGLCVESGAGMGNLFIVDFIYVNPNPQGPGPSGAPFGLVFDPQGTIYWHER